MDELSAVWYSGFHWNLTTQSYRQTKGVLVAVLLIVFGFLMAVVALIKDNLQMRTGGFTMFGLGLLTLVCLCCSSYFKQRSSQGAPQRNRETSVTQSAEYFELILRERDSFNTNDMQRTSLSTSRRDINFLLSRILGSPPTYEEVTRNADYYDATTGVACAPPPYYTDLSDDDGEGVYVDGNAPPPSYERSVTPGITTSEV